MKKRIGIVTSTRADWGLLSPLANQLKLSRWAELVIFATGTHFLDSYGLTYKNILQDGFEIAERIDAQLYPISAASINKTIALTIAGFADVFQRNRVDLLVVLGDRYEILAVSFAAANERIPIAHLHGGEQTEGALDESFRHAITKMSSIHFTANEQYRKRVIQLGENPKTVFNVGAIGVDNILNHPYSTSDELALFLGIGSLERPYAVVTFHPETMISQKDADKQLDILLSSLDLFTDILFIFTLSNADLGSLLYNQRIQEFCQEGKNRLAVGSMGNYYYLGAIRNASFVIGNSSSGIIEVPYFKVPTINIGDRQRGRIAPKSVINCPVKRESIISAIQEARSASFLNSLANMEQLYGDGHTAKKIVAILEDELSIMVSNQSRRKGFFDINFSV